MTHKISEFCTVISTSILILHLFVHRSTGGVSRRLEFLGLSLVMRFLMIKLVPRTTFINRRSVSLFVVSLIEQCAQQGGGPVQLYPLAKTGRFLFVFLLMCARTRDKKNERGKKNVEADDGR